MSIVRYLRWALWECLKEEGPYYNPDKDRGAFESVSDAIGDALEGWQYEITDMLDRQNWRLDHVSSPDNGEIRKPRIYLKVRLTTKDNLVLEWFPWEVDTTRLAETDWLYWSDMWPPGSGMPMNRILMLDKFGFLMHPYKRPFRRSERWLLEAAQMLLHHIYRLLGRFFEVTVLDDLYLEYEETSPACDRLLSAVRIRSVKEVELEREQSRKEEWLAQTFGNRLKMPPQQFLLLFKENDMKIGRVTRIIAEKHLIQIGETAVRTILTILYRDFPAIYDKVLTLPPKGVSLRSGTHHASAEPLVNIPKSPPDLSDEEMMKVHPRWGQWGNVTREELSGLVWTKAATQIAHDFGISDVAVAKKCKAFGISKPPRGHWAKVYARQETAAPKSAPKLVIRNPEKLKIDQKGQPKPNGRKDT